MFIQKTNDVSVYEKLVTLKECQSTIENNKVRGYHQYNKTNIEDILIETAKDYINDNSKILKEAESNGVILDRAKQLEIIHEELKITKHLKSNNIDISTLTESICNISEKYENLYTAIYESNCDLETYEGLMYKSYIDACDISSNELVNHMCFESSYIVDRLNEMDILQEADEAKKEEKPNTPGAVTKATNNAMYALKEFLLKLRNMFKEKLEKIKTRDQKWLQSNKKKLTNVKLTGIEVSLHSNWNVKVDDMLTRQKQVANIIEKYDTDTPYSELESKLEQYKDPKGDLKKGLLNFYNTSKSKEEPKVISVKDEQLRPIITSMMNYCLAFTDVSNKISGQIRAGESLINKYNRNAKERGIKENFCLVENDFYINTDLALCENFHLLLEAEDKTKVGVVKRDETQQTTDKMSDSALSNGNKGIKQHHLTLTTLLTALETKYFENIKILRAILKEGKE